MAMTQFLFLILLVLAAIILAKLSGIRSKLDRVERSARGRDDSLKSLSRRVADLERQLEPGEPPKEGEAPPKSTSQVPVPRPIVPEPSTEIPAVAKPRPPKLETASEDEPAAASTAQPPQPVFSTQAESQPVAKAKSAPSIFDRAIEKVKTIGPADPNMGWEMALYTYWFPRIGAVALSIAVVFLLTLAAQRVGPPARVAIGYGVAAALLGGGWRLERRYKDYSRVLHGAGLALTYFVTYATYFVPYAKIFETPIITLILLALIVGGAVALAQKRRSRTIAILSTLLGHFTIATATLSIEDPDIYAVSGIVLLSGSSAFFLVRNGWHYVALLGMVGSYLNHTLVLSQSEGNNLLSEFIAGMSVLTVYLIIFALAEFFSPRSDSKPAISRRFRSAFVTLNTACYLGIGSFFLEGFTFTPEYHHIFRYLLAAALLSMGAAYLWRGGAHPLHNAYFTKGTAILTLGLAFQFSGNSLTAWLAVEMVAVLISARRSALLVARLLAFALAYLAFVHGLYSIASGSFIAYGAPGYTAALVLASLTLLAFLAASQLYQRTDWTTRSPKTLPFLNKWGVPSWELDLVSEKPEGRAEREKPFGGLLFPHLYAWGAVILVLAYGLRLAEFSDRPIIYSVLALAIAFVAVERKSYPFGSGACVVAAASFAWALLAIADVGFLTSEDVTFPGTLTKAAITGAGLLGLSELARRSRARGSIALPACGYHSLGEKLSDSKVSIDAPKGEHEPLLPTIAALGTGILAAAFTFQLAPEGDRILYVGLGALAFIAAAWALDALSLAAPVAFLVAVAVFAGPAELAANSTVWTVIAGIAAIAGVSLFSESRYIPSKRALLLHRAEYAPYCAYAAVAWLAGLYCYYAFDGPHAISALLVCAVAAAALTWPLHLRALSYCATSLLFAGQILWLVRADQLDGGWRFALPCAGAALALLGEQYFRRRAVPAASSVLIVASAIVLYYFTELETADVWGGFSWAALAFGYLAYAIAFRSRAAGGTALIGATLACVLQIGNAYRLQTDVAPLVAGFIAVAAFWIVCERLHTLGGSRINVRAPKRTELTCVAAAAVLLVLMLERIPFLAQFYLTVSWSVLAVGLFGLGFAFSQKVYRHAGLAVIILSSLRVIAIDTRELEALQRVAAWAVLGAILLALGLGYVRATTRKSETQPSKDDALDVPSAD